jgi:hypothetical protein
MNAVNLPAAASCPNALQVLQLFALTVLAQGAPGFLRGSRGTRTPQQRRVTPNCSCRQRLHGQFLNGGQHRPVARRHTSSPNLAVEGGYFDPRHSYSGTAIRRYLQRQHVPISELDRYLPVTDRCLAALVRSMQRPATVLPAHLLPRALLTEAVTTPAW